MFPSQFYFPIIYSIHPVLHSKNHLQTTTYVLIDANACLIMRETMQIIFIERKSRANHTFLVQENGKYRPFRK